MPVVDHDMLFPAPQEEVFGMIRRVDEFPRYADAVESVTPLDDKTYRWQVRANGMVFHWDVTIIDEDPPHMIRWQSLSGIRNTGHYRFSAVPGGTRVQLTIEYHLPTRLLDKTVGRVAKPIIHHISRQAFERIRRSVTHTQALASSNTPVDPKP
ncbi:Polyketide cyclase / dehydrase and lipid transport [Ectothiorhodospira magna]|uniref:Polyketide cyclase / dehydrase and lipid transport n=1 Tax=Ectothiorhodospira magna TaxID=867345 RepID=A0A1H9FDT2_9GAMM|nr:SRPBCC family protein [Ectothiorhodospira magna]SEQ36005.1 Polyketide cyclase / dehydrase and lipid transport [Ectothiorhodospira magna]